MKCAYDTTKPGKHECQHEILPLDVFSCVYSLGVSRYLPEYVLLGYQVPEYLPEYVMWGYPVLTRVCCLGVSRYQPEYGLWAYSNMTQTTSFGTRPPPSMSHTYSNDHDILSRCSRGSNTIFASRVEVSASLQPIN